MIYIIDSKGGSDGNTILNLVEAKFSLDHGTPLQLSFLIVPIFSHAVRAAEENSQSLMSLQQIRQVQRMAGSKESLLFDAGYFSSAASKNKVGTYSETYGQFPKAVTKISKAPE